MDEYLVNDSTFFDEDFMGGTSDENYGLPADYNVDEVSNSNESSTKDENDVSIWHCGDGFAIYCARNLHKIF